MTTFGHSRREPQKGKNGFSTLRGFTLIELMVVIALVAIITSFALPSYRTLIEKRQVTSGAEQIGAFLSSAQLESVKRNQFVSVSYTEWDGGWCLGLTAADAATTCDCSDTSDVTAADACEIDGAFKILNSSALTYPDILTDATVGTDDTIVYDPVRGLLLNAEDATMELLSYPEGTYALNVEVEVTGRVKICSDRTLNKDVPGYKECSS